MSLRLRNPCAIAQCCDTEATLTHPCIIELFVSVVFIVFKFSYSSDKGAGYYISFLLIVTVVAVTIPAITIGTASFMVVLRLYTRKNTQYKVIAVQAYHKHSQIHELHLHVCRLIKQMIIDFKI